MKKCRVRVLRRSRDVPDTWCPVFLDECSKMNHVALISDEELELNIYLE